MLDRRLLRIGRRRSLSLTKEKLRFWEGEGPLVTLYLNRTFFFRAHQDTCSVELEDREESTESTECARKALSACAYIPAHVSQE